jgi:hypothetical protein
MSPFFVYAVCLGLGYLGPDFWLGRKIKKRQGKIRRGLPDVLDLLVICIEAGLSLDQGTVRTSEELAHAQPELCDELHVVVLEQRAGRPRQDTWKHLAERTDVDCVRNLVSMLIQAEQFGTSIGKTLAHTFRHAQNAAHSASGRAGSQDHHQADLPTGLFHFSFAVPGYIGTRDHHHDGFIQTDVQHLRPGERRIRMDSVTIIRIVAGVVVRRRAWSSSSTPPLARQLAQSVRVFSGGA